MSVRNDLLSAILVQYGGTAPDKASRNELLSLIVSELGGTPTEQTRNGLLNQILGLV